MSNPTPAPTVSTKTITTTTDSTTVEVMVIDTHVKAIQSTKITQYYYIEKRFTAPPEDKCIGRIRNISLMWISGIPGFFECQLEDGSRVTIHVNDLKVERKDIDKEKELNGNTSTDRNAAATTATTATTATEQPTDQS